MAKKVVTFGEIMLRLAPEGYYRFVQADKFTATYGGGEANVAVSLANYGLDVKFVTKLPKHEIGQAAINSLRKYGVDTADIVRCGERVFIIWKRELLKELPRLSMTAPVPRSVRRQKKNLTGRKFLMELNGFISQVLLRHCMIM